ncbi:uncharacterized protein ndufv3 [Syngnathus typhle]|uniref:uncharacterized protein ndufv3 n=1 Tax=Syngnathus typhle TaxID=161592 RepID=UPI002A69D4DF|nr:uncharacterized protein ndufv3 [Syngnathus typhle]XP_061142430.1 uncharacterized protein ndufv3 [Syngnathus typhle]
MSIPILLVRQLWTSKCYLLKSWGTLSTCMSALCTSQTGEAVKSTAKGQSPEHGGDSRRQAVTLGELDRAVDGPHSISRTDICCFVQGGTEPAKMVPKPEDAFDNSKYQNYQHHSYTPYTFADMDLEMAKYRLPQPTSGRPSPQH